MAKITTIKFQIKGIDYSVNVNVGVNGYFSARIPKEVAEALSLYEKLEQSTLYELEKKIKDAVERYKNAVTTQEIFILIKYQSRGFYAYRDNGFAMYAASGSPYQLSTGFGDNIDALGFQFKVCMKETVDGVENWFETRLGSKFMTGSIELESPNTYFKDDKCYHSENWKKIPFNEIALQTLTNARERIRAVSEMLLEFVKQDEEQILLTLTNQKLLG